MTYLILAGLTLLLAVAFAACWPLLGHVDNQLGGDDMLFDARPTLRDRAREWLGIDHIHRQLNRIEETMATIVDQLNQLQSDFSSFAADVDVKLDQLSNAQGDFTPEAQQVFDSIKQAVSDAHTKVGDADGSDTPPVVNGGE